MNDFAVLERLESKVVAARDAIAHGSPQVVCEAFRNLLGEALLASGCKADYWNDETIGKVLSLFDQAIDVAADKYRHNVAERFWDYCQTVEHAKEFECAQSLRSSGDDVYLAPLAWLYVLLVNFYREVDRESLDPDDEAYGRKQLADMVIGIREVAVPRIATHCASLGRFSPEWSLIQDDLEALEAVVTDAISKAELKELAMEATEQLLSRISDLADAADGAKRFVEQMGWFRSPSTTAAQPRFTGELEAAISPQVKWRFQSIILNGRLIAPPRALLKDEGSTVDDDANLDHINLEFIRPLGGPFELGVWTSAASQVSAADLELARKFPGKHVAYVDHWTEDSAGRHLRREPLADDASFHSLQQKVERIISERRFAEADIRYQYVESDDLS